MSNYFRITVYHPVHNISAIMDSNGKFEKLWQFAAFLVSKGFKVIEVGNSEKFIDGNIKKNDNVSDKLILRACSKYQPTYRTKIVHCINYNAISVKNHYYIPVKSFTTLIKP